MGVGPQSFSDDLDAYVALVTAILAGLPDLREKHHWVAINLPRTYAGLLLKRDWDELFKEEAG